MRPVIFILMLLTLAACSASAAAADPVAAGGRTYLIQCGGCHAISDAGPNSLGPRLDAIVARAKASSDPTAWLRRAITNPAAETSPGYQPGLMPLFYGQTLSPAELNALVTYMLKAGGT
ncbi:MAG: c-type cytochrome [Chloroflexales bacterium]